MCLAVPGQVIEIEGDEQLTRKALVDFSGIRKSVSLGLMPEVELGDYLLVHAGVAISRIDEDYAQKTLDYLNELGELEEELGENEVY